MMNFIILFFPILLFGNILLCISNISFQVRLKKEQEEKEQKRKEKAEAHLYTIIKVIAFKILFLYLSWPTHDAVCGGREKQLHSDRLPSIYIHFQMN